jgi:hypothetical protein
MESEKKSVYIESTIPSYASSRPSRDILKSYRQNLTKIFWEDCRQEYDLFISQYVIDECRRGDSVAARRRMDFIRDIISFPETEEIDRLADTYFHLLDIPERAKTDCSHLAVCVCEKLDYLLTWNCTHLGMVSYTSILKYNEKHGLWTPVLITPETMIAMEEEKHELS